MSKDFVFTMKGLSKKYGSKTVLKDIYLSFYYGAKIRIIGLNGSGKSSLLRIMAGVDTNFLGEAVLSAGYTVGYLEQEPKLDESKTVKQIVEEAVQSTVDLLKEFEEINMKFAEPMTDDEMKAAFQALEQEIATAQEAKNKDLAKKNTEEGAAFLAANKKKPGIKTTASGLQYKVLKEGTGPVPKKTDTVSTHYRGTLLDGTEFDSSIARNEPATFPVTGVIPGWTEALQLMKVGSKWQLFIPAELAYRDQGAGADIGPNAVLVFDIELLGIEK